MIIKTNIDLIICLADFKLIHDAVLDVANHIN